MKYFKLLALLFLSTNCFAWTINVDQVNSGGKTIDNYRYQVGSDKGYTIRPFSDLVCMTQPYERIMFISCWFKGQLPVSTMVSPEHGWATLMFSLDTNTKAKYTVNLIHE